MDLGKVWRKRASLNCKKEADSFTFTARFLSYTWSSYSYTLTFLLVHIHICPYLHPYPSTSAQHLNPHLSLSPPISTSWPLSFIHIQILHKSTKSTLCGPQPLWTFPFIIFIIHFDLQPNLHPYFGFLFRQTEYFSLSWIWLVLTSISSSSSSSSSLPSWHLMFHSSCSGDKDDRVFWHFLLNTHLKRTQMYNLETHLALCNASYHTTLVARMRGYFDTSCQYVDYLMHCWKTLLKYIEMILKFLKRMYNLETHLKFALCNTLYHSGILTLLANTCTTWCIVRKLSPSWVSSTLWYLQYWKLVWDTSTIQLLCFDQSTILLKPFIRNSIYHLQNCKAVAYKCHGIVLQVLYLYFSCQPI